MNWLLGVTGSVAETEADPESEAESEPETEVGFRNRARRRFSGVMLSWNFVASTHGHSWVVHRGR